MIWMKVRAGICAVESAVICEELSPLSAAVSREWTWIVLRTATCLPVKALIPAALRAATSIVVRALI